ncbi:restriction endonuclease subunit S [Secundilactobacillus mixtipabuli]|uniref:Type I restriction-modification system specificity subunit S n=1 Tax=Secundilactobacillus mixtipabuli TaxID=1435342 RepID=A0A1Z5IAB6_9LACO|nr:restriction endonuclease subunit S [Secundilactobacillus mixtipabuli]GAW98733.1 type I restriction-modification system specificity subunit S [Secundilactobacillus mixtipabuli]
MYLFKGHVWEQRKLSELSKIFDSARISNSLWTNKGVPYLRSSDINTESRQDVLNISLELFQKLDKQTGSPKQGDLLIVSGGTPKSVGLTFYKDDNSPIYVQGGAILYAQTSKSSIVDGNFLHFEFLTRRLRKYVHDVMTGISIRHFTVDPVSKTSITFPSITEQQNISGLFDYLDSAIAHHQRELFSRKIMGIKIY